MKEAALALAYTGGGDSPHRQMDPWQSRTLMVLAAAVALCCLAPNILRVAGVDFSTVASGAFQPTYWLMGWSVVTLIALTSVLALTHFGIDSEDLTTPLIGVVLLVCGVANSFYAIYALQPESAPALLADRWLISRAHGGLSLFLVAGVALWLVCGDRCQALESRDRLKTTVLLVAVGLVAGVLLASLHRWQLAGLPEGVRNWVPALFEVLSIPLFVALFRKVRTLFAGALMLMLLPLLALEAHMLFSFQQVYDDRFNLAMALNLVAILTLFAGLLCQYVSSYRAVEDAKRELVINQHKLDVALQTLTRSNERLMHANCHDHLTGAANREFFFREAERATARARRSKQRVGFLYLDLDKFKQVNDAYGHSVGDEVLCCFAERIRTVMRREDCLARVGGDEFVLMVENVGELEDLSSVAEKIMGILRGPVQTAKGELDVAVSIGIAAFPETADVTDLVKHADIAMYEAKSNETSKFQVFTQELNRQHAENLALQRELPEALREGQLSLVYQPVYDAATQKPVAVEALVRWNHPERGFVSPGKFIPIAEKSTFINNLGSWVFEQACQQLASWREDHGLRLAMGVNVSVRQLYTDNLLATIRRCLTQYRIPAGDITLEITEGQLIQDLKACKGTIEALKALGVTIALDDYGSGFASITHLRNLPIDFLKIDRSLIRNAPRNPQNRVLTRTTIELAHSLDLPVIVEGVEHQEELDLVRQYRSDFVQGFYLAKPMAVPRCTEFLVERCGLAEAAETA